MLTNKECFLLVSSISLICDGLERDHQQNVASNNDSKFMLQSSRGKVEVIFREIQFLNGSRKEACSIFTHIVIFFLSTLLEVVDDKLFPPSLERISDDMNFNVTRKQTLNVPSSE